MESIAGLPTVVGGVSSNQFLSSVEVLDNSNNDDAPLGLEWRVAAHSMATPRYDFALAAVPITQVLSEDMLNKEDVCGMNEGKFIDLFWLRICNNIFMLRFRMNCKYLSCRYGYDDGNGCYFSCLNMKFLIIMKIRFCVGA